MRKLAILFSVLCLMLALQSIKIVSPGESTTIDFSISNPSGSYEFCVDSILVQFTDHLGDIKVVTPMPVYPKVCVCPPSDNSSCLSYANAGKAYGQSLGYKYGSSNMFGLRFNITIDPNAASSLVYPGVEHNYDLHYSYKFVNCQMGCWFENPQQESYTGIIYVHGLTQNEIIMAQGGAPSEKLAATSLSDAQQYISDAFNAIEQANSTIESSATAPCVSTSKAYSYLSDAMNYYPTAKSYLLAAQDAYNSKNYDAVKYNATIAKQLAVQTKNEADMATSFIQAELQRVEAISNKMTQANLSVSYSIELERQAKKIGVSSDGANSLNSLALEYVNKTDSACKAGAYDIVVNSANSAMDKANSAKQILEPLVRDKLAGMYGTYIENLSKARAMIGNLSGNYGNFTIDNLTDYRDNIQNGNYTDFLIYMQSLPSTEAIVEKTVSGFAGLNQTIEMMQNITILSEKYHQETNLSEVNLLLQNSVKELSIRDFNLSLNLTNEAKLRLIAMGNELGSRISQIENAKTLIETAGSTMADVSNDTFFILKPDLSESELALSRANGALYSQPDKSASFAIQARVLAIEQRRKTNSIKLGIAGVVIIIIILAVIISRIRNPFRIKRRPFRER
ncbi:hypothetical protein H0N98_05280 [Candidatus Micrarchaeota archaeon]|nr:hypothetical protein [Candidatus Micrarchaeota archaeon]